MRAGQDHKEAREEPRRSALYQPSSNITMHLTIPLACLAEYLSAPGHISIETFAVHLAGILQLSVKISIRKDAPRNEKIGCLRA